MNREELTDYGAVTALLRRHGFRFSKSLGQNFLVEAWVPERIAREARLTPETGVLEVGPGVGVLTCRLAQRAGKVVALELDRTLLPVLEETLAECQNVRVVQGDVLKTDLRALAEETLGEGPKAACANLPYYITTPAVEALLTAGCFDSVTVMVQREVAERMAAAPGTKAYGAFSVFCQYHAQVEYLFTVPPECFHPRPKVTSAVVRLELTGASRAAPRSEALFFRTVRAAFSQRRKTLLNCLASGFGAEYTREELAQIVENCGLSPSCRGETLSLEEFSQLSDALGTKSL